MKFTAFALLAASPLLAQTATHTAARRSAASVPGASGSACVKLPELSPRIPALPAGLPCPRALYTLTFQPSIRLDYQNPLEGPDLKDQLGIDPATVSLAFVEVKPGTGDPVALHKFVSVHYTGYLVDGTKFDSSIDRGEPITIPYGAHQVIPGWDTGLAGMRVGGKRRLFIPYQLAYGTQQHQSIPGKSMLIFDLELTKVSDTPPPPPARPAAPPPAGAPGRPATAPGAGSAPAPDGAKPAAPAPSTDPTKPTTAPPPPTSQKP